MTEDRKLEMNGPPNPAMEQRGDNQNPRGGGRRPNRFGPRGPPRNFDRQSDDQVKCFILFIL